MSQATNIFDLINTCILPVEKVKALIVNLSCPTNVELNNIRNQARINTVDIPNQDYVC